MSEPAAEISAETAADEKVVGRPFEPGKSGNPGGRPKGLAKTVREVLGRAAKEGEDASIILAEFWANVMADPNAKMEHRIKASELLADRGWGKAPQYAPIEDEDPLDLSAERTSALAQEMDKRIDEVARRRQMREAAQSEPPTEAAPQPDLGDASV